MGCCCSKPVPEQSEIVKNNGENEMPDSEIVPEQYEINENGENEMTDLEIAKTQSYESLIETTGNMEPLNEELQPGPSKSLMSGNDEEYQDADDQFYGSGKCYQNEACIDAFDRSMNRSHTDSYFAAQVYL